MSQKKAKIEQEHVEEAEKLRRIFEARPLPRLSQAKFGEQYEIGSQGVVWQYLNARIPLNVEQAVRFARGLNCAVADFSPRLAAELAALQEIPPLSAAQRDAVQAALAAEGWKVSRCGPGVTKRFEIGPTPLDADLKLEKDGHVLWGVFFPWYRVRQSDLPRLLIQPGLVGLLDDPESSVANASFGLESARRAADPDRAAAEDAEFDKALRDHNIPPIETIGDFAGAPVVARPSVVSEELWESLTPAVHTLIETARSLSDDDLALLTQIAQRMAAKGTQPPMKCRNFLPPVPKRKKDRV